MSKLCKVLQACAVAALIAGPAWALPTLSAHAPTIGAPIAPASSPLSQRGLPTLLAPAAGITVKADAGTIATKWSSRASAASGDYQTGVQAAGAKWQQNTTGAASAYEQGVTQAISKKRFAAGVTQAAQAKFTRNATTNGPQRYQTGVAGAQNDYQAGVQPYMDVLKGINLPPRGPKGSPANMQRAQAVAAALFAKKMGS